MSAGMNPTETLKHVRVMLGEAARSCASGEQGEEAPIIFADLPFD